MFLGGLRQGDNMEMVTLFPSVETQDERERVNEHRNLLTISGSSPS